jgi:hypothetical protein
MFGNIHRNTPSTQVKKERKPATSMVPLFSRRSIILIAIGCVVGAALGLGYWIISPMLSSPTKEAATQPESGFFQSLRPSPTGPWEGTATIQVVNPGSSVIVMSQLQNMARYYASKASTLPFYQYLSKELAAQAPLYSHNADELDQMITIKYDAGIEEPTITIMATAPTVEETTFLTSNIPEIFRSYLIAEESAKKQQEYQNILQSIEDVKASLLVSKQELSLLMPEGAASDILNDPAYVALNAKITALQSELELQATQLSTIITTGDVGKDNLSLKQEYEKTLQEARGLSTTLSNAEQELRSLEGQQASTDIQNNPTYIALGAKIQALQAELDRLMTGYTELSGNIQTYVPGLAEMISSGATTDADYQNTLKKVETTSVALAEAKKEMTVLNAHASDNMTSMNLDYQLAQIKVNNLEKQMTRLTDKLNLLSSEETSGDSQLGIQATFDRTSLALAEARKELAVLTSQASENITSLNLDYQLAQAKVNSFQNQLTNLNNSLSSSLVDKSGSVEVTDYLSVGKPGLSLPVFPASMRGKNALLLGAIVGIFGAWLILNFRWLVKKVTSTPATPENGRDKQQKEDEL